MTDNNTSFQPSSATKQLNFGFEKIKIISDNVEMPHIKQTLFAISGPLIISLTPMNSHFDFFYIQSTYVNQQLLSSEPDREFQNVLRFIHNTFYNIERSYVYHKREYDDRMLQT